VIQGYASWPHRRWDLFQELLSNSSSKNIIQSFGLSGYRRRAGDRYAELKDMIEELGINQQLHTASIVHCPQGAQSYREIRRIEV
jgi:hypothetical protein